MLIEMESAQNQGICERRLAAALMLVSRWDLINWAIALRSRLSVRLATAPHTQLATLHGCGKTPNRNRPRTMPSVIFSMLNPFVRF